MCTDGPVGCVTPTKSDPDLAVVGVGRRIALVNWKNGEVTYLTEDLEPGTKNRMNDGKCDPSGRLWVGRYIFDE